MRAFVHFETPNSTDPGFSDVREFVRIPCIGEVIATGPNGPIYCVVMVNHYAAEGEEPTMTVYAIRIEEDRLQSLTTKLTT